MYGKFDAKNGVLASLKIQIPLFGQYLGIQEKFDEIVSFLMKNGLFMKADKLQTSNGIIYQISCKDYEVLELFAKWYEPVEKFEKISKLDFVNEMKIKLIDFIKTEKLIPEEGKVDSIAFIEK